MTESIDKKIVEVRDLVKDLPADVKTHILFRVLQEELAPVHAELMMKDEVQSTMVAKQIKLITNICSAVIEFLDVRKANIK